jgi:membrane protease YdiL (CAAX protease family)
VANYILLPLFVYNNHETVSLRYAQLKYTTLVFSYLFLAFCMLLEKENLENFHIDKASLLIFSCTAIPFFRPILNISGENYALVSIAASGVLIFFVLYQNWSKIPSPNFYWTLIGILITCIILIPANYINYLAYSSVGNAKFDILEKSIHDLIYNLSFVSVAEEMIFRGFLWGYLRLMGWSEKKAFVIQFVLFWAGHAFQITTSPLTFFISTPIISLVVSYLTYRSKQIFPSIISHTLYNTFIATFWRLIVN